MAQLIFLPHYAAVLDSVLDEAWDEGVVDVECRADLDPVVVASQVQAYAELHGSPVTCRPLKGRVEVRSPRRGRSPGGHPATRGA